MKVAQELSYKGYRLLVSPVGKGWRAMIFPPGSSSRCPKVLQRLRKVPKKRLLPRQRKLSTHGSMHKIDELSARCSCADKVIAVHESAFGTQRTYRGQFAHVRFRSEADIA